jgi:pyrroline-5-carboxylate reductase
MSAQRMEQLIGFIGAGNMAEAMIRGLLNGKVSAAAGIAASDVNTARRDVMERTYGIRTTADNLTLVQEAGVIVLAVKPQVAHQVLGAIRPATGPQKLLISIVAGLTIGAMTERLQPGTRIIRTVPNTPVFVGEGMVAIAPGPTATPADMLEVEAIFGPVARTAALDEKLMDAALGVSGSGPAYVFLVIDALADGGVKMGLPKPLALTLAAQTVLGAARMCLESGKHPAELKDMVTSPGGTTIAALHQLEKGALRATLISAVEAAARRAEELGRLG